MTTDNSDTKRPVLGLIVPPAAGLVPPEGPEMYPEIDFIAQGLALSSVDKEGYDQVIDQVVEAAQKLAARGARAVSLMGTSLSFYRGSDFNEELVARLRESTGLPCSTMSHAILRGLRVSSIERVAVASSYIDDVNQRLVRFLDQNQIQAVCAYGLGVNDVTAMSKNQHAGAGRPVSEDVGHRPRAGPRSSTRFAAVLRRPGVAGSRASGRGQAGRHCCVQLACWLLGSGGDGWAGFISAGDGTTGTRASNRLIPRCR